MADKVETLRFFAERVAHEAAGADYGHLPLQREGIDIETSWYHDGEQMIMIVEGNGKERTLTLSADGDTPEGEIADALVGVLGEVS